MENMEGFDDFMANGHGSTERLMKTFDHDERPDLINDDDHMHEVVQGYVDADHPTPFTALSSPMSPYGSQNQPRTGPLNPYATDSTLANSRPSVFNPFDGALPAPRSKFTPPKTDNPIAQPGQSIFGPKAQTVGRTKDIEVFDDRQGPRILFSPYREPVESEISALQRSPERGKITITLDNQIDRALIRSAVDEELSTQQRPNIRDSDSDNELEIIDAGNASSTAKARWQEFRPPIMPDTSHSPFRKVKKESMNESALPFLSRIPISQPSSTHPPRITDMAAILASQRALLNKNKVKAKESFRGQRRSAEELPYTGHSNTRKHLFEGKVVAEDPEQVEAAMRAESHEDDSWMNEEPSEDETAAEIEIVKGKIEVLARIEANGKISEIEMLELLRLRKYLRLQERLKRAANGDRSREPQEEKLFVPADRDEMLARKRQEQKQLANHGITPDMDLECNEEGDYGDDFDSRERESSQGSEQIFNQMLKQELHGDGLDDVPAQEASRKKKPRKKSVKNAREFYLRQGEERRQRERAKAQKAKSKGAKGAKGGRKPPGKGKGSVSKKGKPATDNFLGNPHGKFNKNDGVDDIGQMIIDMMSNDPIAERLQNPIFDVEPEPDMHGKHVKQSQLQRLLANIPEGTDTQKARSDKARLQQASRVFGYAKVKAVNGKWLIKGMKSTLYHHQLIGAHWMIGRELSDEPPYGGLLADGMGLGKTVQTLACMVGNPPGEEDQKRGVKATLIVVPSSVIEQWMDEIERHADSRLFPKIMHYKRTSKVSLEILRDLDIVITSYQEVMRHFPFPKAKDRENIAKNGYKKWWKNASKHMGDLYGVYWYRVVLDEAHAIKNNSARTSLACQNLRSVFRWCLTGTPLLNRLEELFPYLRFLKANYSMDWKTFQRYFCDPDADDCHARISTLLSYTMMRRTMSTTIFNRPIITLPKPHPEIRYVQFSAEERLIYRITENRFRANLNVYFANGTAGRKYGLFLVQLLRLRQCTSHPFMLEGTIKNCWTSSDLKELKTRLKSLAKTNLPFYEQCQVWITQTEEEREAARARGENPNEVGVGKGEGMSFGASDFGYSFNMNKALKTLSAEEMYARVTCGICSDIPRSPMLTDCNHIFCKECLTSYMYQKVALTEEEYMDCPTCDKIFSSFKPFRGLTDGDEEDVETESQNHTHCNSQGHGKKRKGRHEAADKGADALGFEPKVKDSTWVDKTDGDSFPLVPSAKMAALKAVLLRGFQEAPTDKVVIYVQFRLLAKIVGRICHSEGWGFLYLTGECSLDHRSKVIKKFRDDNDVKILIAGLKCGGLGLNFPWANRCISLDLWWNHAVEQQAFGRIFRIGQMKETYMTRIIVKNTVDMRLLSMQLHKLKACSSAVESGEEKNKPVLSLHQLAGLFGFLKTDDKTGEIIEIQSDDQDED